jgi:hypothetical protein
MQSNPSLVKSKTFHQLFAIKKWELRSFEYKAEYSIIAILQDLSLLFYVLIFHWCCLWIKEHVYMYMYKL